MDEYLKGEISYSNLRNIIFMYFEENMNLILGCSSINDFENKLTGIKTTKSYFYFDGEFGESRFDLSKKDIIEILRLYLANKNCELSKLCFADRVVFTYRYNPNISYKDIKLDLIFNSVMRYDVLRQIILNYFKEKNGLKLGSLDIDIFKEKIAGNIDEPYFYVKGKFGKSRFDLSKENIEYILSVYLKNKGYILKNLTFGDFVEFKYIRNENKEKEFDDSSKNFNNNQKQLKKTI